MFCYRSASPQPATLARRLTLLATVIVLLLTAAGADAGTGGSRHLPKLKKNSRSVQPVGEGTVVRTEGASFGTGLKGSFQVTEERARPAPILTYSLSWTILEAWRVSTDPVEAVLEASIENSEFVIWSFMDAINPGSPPTGLHFVEDRNGGSQGPDLPIALSYRFGAGPWLALEDYGSTFGIPVPPGNHEIEIRFHSALPPRLDPGFYRLTLDHIITAPL